MTPELLKRTARIVCRLRGFDPDEALVFSQQTRWQSLVPEILPVAQILLALDEASESAKAEEEE